MFRFEEVHVLVEGNWCNCSRPESSLSVASKVAGQARLASLVVQENETK